MRYVLEDCSSGRLIHERALTPSGDYIGRFDETSNCTGYGSILGPRIICTYQAWINALDHA